ncbi:hypothetical protein Bbelb_051110 [Branchiostoma belcheri]|nr:hypothetical protein Bbelb_051110 [Branchiostoma belcheri]
MKYIADRVLEHDASKTTRHTKLNNVRFIGENAIRLAKYSYRLVDALEMKTSLKNVGIFDVQCLSMANLEEEMDHVWDYFATTVTQLINMSIKIVTIKIQRQPTKMVAINPEKLFALTGDRRFHRDELKRTISTMTRAMNFLSQKSSQPFFRKRDGKHVIGKAVSGDASEQQDITEKGRHHPAFAQLDLVNLSKYI